MPAAGRLLLAFLALPAGAATLQQRGREWQETQTAHYRILHQAFWLPPGLTLGLEHVSSRLNMGLGMFSRMTTSNRATIYLYKDMKSYVNGEFKPPEWSNGICIYDKNAIAIPAARETPSMLRTLAHENTHLIFMRYFQGGHGEPPSWVNEGLAMLEETDPWEKPELSHWYQNMAEMDPKRWFPLEDFFKLSPIKDLQNDKERVAVFYVQAYSLTQFLLRKHAPFQYKTFCDGLRDGKSAEESLTLAYHYRRVSDLERQWRAWVADPAHKKRVDMLTAAQRAEGDEVIDQAGPSRLTGFSKSWKLKSVFLNPER